MMSAIHVFEPDRILSAMSATELLVWITQKLESGIQFLLIDLHKVSFMDSSGLGALVSAVQKVQQSGGTLAICSLNGQARMLFELSNLDQFFQIYANRTEFEQALMERSPQAPETV
jgi:anti-sigma B factor antagonist